MWWGGSLGHGMGLCGGALRCSGIEGRDGMGLGLGGGYVGLRVLVGMVWGWVEVGCGGVEGRDGIGFWMEVGWGRG